MKDEEKKRRSCRRGGYGFLLLSGLIAMGAACGFGEENTTQDGITIRLWTQDHWLGITGHELDGVPLDDPRRAKYTRKDWFNKVAEEFLALYPDRKIRVDTEILDWVTGYQKIDIAVASGLPPDILISTSGIALKYARFGLLEPFDEHITPEDIADFGPFYAFSEYEGKHYFLPFIGGSQYLLANRRIFREAGVEHLLPTEGDRLWTYEQFLAAAKATTLDRDHDGKTDVWGFALPFQRISPQQEQLPFFWGHGARQFNTTGDTLRIDSDAAGRALQFMVDLEHRHRVIPPGSAGMRNNDVTDLWNAGRLAMRRGFHGSLAAHRRALETGVVKPDVIELYPLMYPGLPGVTPGNFVVADSPCIFRQYDPEKRRIVIAFAKFLTNTQHVREAAYALSTLPTRASAADVWSNDPYQQYVLRMAK
ncbi:MAG: extracellular solute-binding protein, partial [candidate division Zixibacteria bacterium]|nr:extracellular solute-binding protein [candidate division Zixibacteria bacterium]